MAKCWGCEQQSGGVEGESDEENLEKFVKVFQQVHSHMSVHTKEYLMLSCLQKLLLVLVWMLLSR